MPLQTFEVVSGRSPSPISPDELKERYFFGIPITDPSGNLMSDEVITDLISFAVAEVEGGLEIKLSKQIIEENFSYHINDWHSWGFIPTTYPVLEVYSMVGSVGTIEKQIEFPQSWLSVKRSTEKYAAQRRVFVVPTVGSAQQDTIVYSGITPHLGWFSMSIIPDYWKITYCTSFKEPPGDILDYIGKLAAINIFHMMGDIILGAGIASQSIGLDGLSQSISTTSSATNAGYGARVTGYLADLKRNLPHLRQKYKGITFTSL